LAPLLPRNVAFPAEAGDRARRHGWRGRAARRADERVEADRLR
jgi:hypothetical protein